ncbi:MAG: hypothetical protein EHM14_04810 [Methanothrix sp.]|nr:MAG: hypothetical protein EHM14_04810 [Methanothrix sp.]
MMIEVRSYIDPAPPRKKHANMRDIRLSVPPPVIESLGIVGKVMENMQDNTVNEAEIASMKKDINDALGADYHDQMQALDIRFTELELGTPAQEDYALMQDAINMLQEEIRDSNDLEYTDDDYEEVTKEFYEDLLEEEVGIDSRGRAVIDFVINRLKSILEGFEVGDEWPGREVM